MALEFLPLGPRRHLPELNHVSGNGGRQKAAVARKGDGSDKRLMSGNAATRFQVAVSRTIPLSVTKNRPSGENAIVATGLVELALFFPGGYVPKSDGTGTWLPPQVEDRPSLLHRLISHGQRLAIGGKNHTAYLAGLFLFSIRHGLETPFLLSRFEIPEPDHAVPMIDGDKLLAVVGERQVCRHPL